MAKFQPELIPAWAKLAAWAVPLCVLPSATWRLTMAISAYTKNDNPCIPASTSLAEKLYVPSLSFIELSFALLTVGLISQWGEVFPRWLPVVGARPIPVNLVATIAIIGAVLVAILVWGYTTTYIMDAGSRNPVPPGCSSPGWNVAILYLPSVLWPPLLLAVTSHYVQRRRMQSAHPVGK